MGEGNPNAAVLLRGDAKGPEACEEQQEPPPSAVEQARNDVAPPYSPRTEVRYFFQKGMPLCLSALMSFGIPPLAAMIFAGHTEQSAHLQASVGYGRVWYNCTALMPLFGMQSYFQITVPGCIGAGRKDRIPRYFQRSVVLNLLIMIPSFLLQFASDGIMEVLGVPSSNAEEVGDYCRLMMASTILQLFNGHFEIAFNNLGYVKCTTLNSVFSGICMDITTTYLFIYMWGWGIHGAALSRILVQLLKLALWGLMTLYFGLAHVICIPRASRSQEPLLPKTEVREFVHLGIPLLLSNFASWFIFELQVIAVTNIRGITTDARAAGANWVQFESVFASVQAGWLSSASMRVLALLGRQDAGARKAFYLFHTLSSIAVALINVFLFVFKGQMCRLVSNDVAVQQWLGDTIWVLVIHTQSRISSLISLFLFIPLGQGMQRTIASFVCFYVIASPISGIVALTDVVTQSLGVKLVACVGATSIAQTVQAVYNFWYLARLDWHEAGVIINRRANTDKRSAGQAGPEETHRASGVSLEELS